MNPDSLTLRFHIGRIPVVVEPWFWLTTLLMASRMTGVRMVLWVGVVFVSILVHELGHAAAARWFGANAWISLHGLGGLTRPDRALSRWRDLAMTLAGPFAGFALGAAVYTLRRHVPMLSHTPNLRWLLHALVEVNIGWGMFNLLPVPPLDGGHAALALAGARRERAVRIGAIVLSVLVVLYAVAQQQMYMGLLVGLMGYRNYQVLTRQAAA